LWTKYYGGDDDGHGSGRQSEGERASENEEEKYHSMILSRKAVTTSSPDLAIGRVVANAAKRRDGQWPMMQGIFEFLGLHCSSREDETCVAAVSDGTAQKCTPHFPGGRIHGPVNHFAVSICWTFLSVSGL